MFDAIARLFTAQDDTRSRVLEPKLAVAALLVHLAAVDGETSESERDAIRGTLMDYYELDEPEVEKLMADATRQDADSVDFYRFTSAIASLPDAEKLEIVRMMWQVVFADRKNHELEDNMVWRIAELIHVSARDRNVLRMQMAR